MKLFLCGILVLLSYLPAGFAYEKSGVCADAAAKAALSYAASFWGLKEKDQEVLFSNITPSSNPEPIQTYDVGIVRQDNHLVQFDVGLEYVRGKCKNIEVRFAEYLY